MLSGSACTRSSRVADRTVPGKTSHNSFQTMMSKRVEKAEKNQNAMYLKRGISELLIRMSIHHRHLHIHCIPWMYNSGAIRTHDSVSRWSKVERSIWDMVVFGKSHLVVRLLHHVEGWYIEILINRKAPYVPAFIKYQPITHQPENGF